MLPYIAYMDPMYIYIYTSFSSIYRYDITDMQEFQLFEGNVKDQLAINCISEIVGSEWSTDIYTYL